MIVVLVALTMAVLPADGATCTDVADRQDQVKALGCNRGVLRFIETSLQCSNAVTPDLNGSLINRVELAEGVYSQCNPVQARAHCDRNLDPPCRLGEYCPRVHGEAPSNTHEAVLKPSLKDPSLIPTAVPSRIAWAIVSPSSVKLISWRAH
jgi:hypothetical protein